MKAMKALLLFVFGLLAIFNAKAENDPNEDDGFGGTLIGGLRNDANLDLPNDEEYEDLRAELLAYHTTLAKLAEVSVSRRALISKPCWQLNGICIDVRLCRGFRYLTQINGCRDRNRVCCFSWNKNQMKDLRSFGIKGVYPWGVKQEFGDGHGVLTLYPNGTKENVAGFGQRPSKSQKLKFQDQFDMDIGEGSSDKEIQEPASKDVTDQKEDQKKADVDEKEIDVEINENGKEENSTTNVEETKGEGDVINEEVKVAVDSTNNHKADEDKEREATNNQQVDEVQAEGDAVNNQHVDENKEGEASNNQQVDEIKEEGVDNNQEVPEANKFIRKNKSQLRSKHKKKYEVNKGKLRINKKTLPAKKQPRRRSSFLKKMLGSNSEEVLQFDLELDEK